MINVFTTCPDDCSEDLQFGAIDVDQDCTTFDTYESQVSDIYIVPKTIALEDHPFDWELGSGDVTKIDNTAIDNSAAHWIVGEGGVGVPEKTRQELAKLKSRISKRLYQLVFNMKNMSTANRNMLLQFQCNPTNFYFYYATVGGMLFGGPGGIDPTFGDADLPLSEARDGIETGILTLEWEAKGDPLRIVNPLA